MGLIHSSSPVSQIVYLVLPIPYYCNYILKQPLIVQSKPSRMHTWSKFLQLQLFPFPWACDVTVSMSRVAASHVRLLHTPRAQTEGGPGVLLSDLESFCVSSSLWNPLPQAPKLSVPDSQPKTMHDGWDKIVQNIVLQLFFLFLHAIIYLPICSLIVTQSQYF